MDIVQFGIYIPSQIGWAVLACLVMMILDVITGFIGAWKDHNIQSTVMREGLFHKAALVILIVLALLCEMFVMQVPELGIYIPLVIPACVIIFAMELVSITENIAIINPDLKSSKLLKLFKVGDDDA